MFSGFEMNFKQILNEMKQCVNEIDTDATAAGAAASAAAARQTTIKKVVKPEAAAEAAAEATSPAEVASASISLKPCFNFVLEFFNFERVVLSTPLVWHQKNGFFKGSIEFCALLFRRSFLAFWSCSSLARWHASGVGN